MSRPVAVAGGLVIDRVLGEPHRAVHPVAGFGKVMERVETSTYAPTRVRGALHAAIGLAIGVGAGVGALGRSTALATYVAVAGRSLGDAATSVERALAVGSLDHARAALPALVGRDPTDLDEAEICRAVVESVAENTVDAVVAPALWAAVAGPPGALAYRAANTMDAMVGHRSERYLEFGWAAARIDDVANWVPARVTAALVAAARPRRARAVARAVRRDAPGHPSPNAGVAEAAFAAALGLRLGGENRYGLRSEVRAPLGDGRPPARDDIADAVRLMRDVSSLLAAALVVPSAIRAVRRRFRARPSRRPAAALVEPGGAR